MFCGSRYYIQSIDFDLFNLLFLQVMWCNILYTNVLFGYLSRLCRVNECIGYLSLFLL